MIDKHISVPLLPSTFSHLTVNAANAIELDLQAIFSELAVFDEVLSGSLGSLGYLEKGETTTLNGNLSDNAVIRMAAVTVTIYRSASVNVTGVGWAVSDLEENGTVIGKTATHSADGLKNIGSILSSLYISTQAEDIFEAVITLSAIGQSGIQYLGSGQAMFLYRNCCTWQVLQIACPTLQMLDGQSWVKIKALNKTNIGGK